MEVVRKEVSRYLGGLKKPPAGWESKIKALLNKGKSIVFVVTNDKMGGLTKLDPIARFH